MKKTPRSLKEMLTGSNLITPTEMAPALGVSRPTVYAWVSKNLIPYVKLQGLVRFEPLEIAAWLKARRQGPGTTVRCPYGDGTIGRDFDSFSECDSCPVREQCCELAAKRVVRVAYK
jgi:excisionase family DNA binding protein